MSEFDHSRHSNRPVSSLAELTAVRFKEFLREPEALFWSFGFPILLAIGLGIAFRNRPPDISHVGVISVSQPLSPSFKRSVPLKGGAAGVVAGWLRRDKQLAVEVVSRDSALLALRNGRLALVVDASNPDGTLRYTYDDTRPDARTARLLVDNAIQAGAGRPTPVATANVIVREKGARYIDFVVPGLLGMTIMGGGIWGLGFSIVDQRRKNLLKRLIATPMSRAEYLASYLMSRIVLLVAEVGLLLGAAIMIFGVPMRGPVGVTIVEIIVSSLTFGGIGLLIASRAKTIEGVSGLMNLVMLPMWVLSGVFFSSKNFPAAVQPFIQALPLTAANDALRATMLQGASWSALGPEFAVLIAWMIGSFVLALKLFRWR
jgi:ABC-type polysaccharide/polyol phosphate export permease